MSDSAPGGVARRRRRVQRLPAHDRWLVSWADFMTLLFAFFVVLFAASHRNQAALGRLSGAIHAGFAGQAGQAAAAPADPLAGLMADPRAGPQRAPGPASRAVPQPAPRAMPGTPPPATDLAGVEGQLRAALGPSIDQGEVALFESGDGLILSFRELGFFRSGEADLLPGQGAKVIEAGEILARHGLALRVEGHSDDQPIDNATFRSNWELSTARAMTVLLLLVDDAHYDPTHLSLAGYGPYRPVADNRTAAGRQQNRRVDLVVLRRPANE